MQRGFAPLFSETSENFLLGFAWLRSACDENKAYENTIFTVWFFAFNKSHLKIFAEPFQTSAVKIFLRLILIINFDELVWNN